MTDSVTMQGSPAQIRQRVSDSSLGVRERSRFLRDEIYRYYRTAVCSGQFNRGQRLPPERKIAEDFGANRKTVRDTLQRLRDEGLIERRPGSGSYVIVAADSPTAATQFETPSVSPMDIIEACVVIEPSLCEIVVARATEDDFQRMRAQLQEMETAKDQVSFKEAGYAYHLEVVRSTRNPLLIAMYEMLIAARAKAGWGTLIPLNDRQDLRADQVAKNRRILEALYARDGRRAQELSYQSRAAMLATVAAFPVNA